MRLKAVQLLVNNSLPADLRQYDRPLDAGGLGKLMSQVARKYPDRYAEILQKIADAGRNASYNQGETLTLRDTQPVLDRDSILAQMDAEVAKARAKIKSEPAFEEARNAIWTRYSDALEKDTQRAAMARGNNLAFSVASGARGKPAQLKAMITTPGLYEDAKGEVVPVFIRHSFGEGLRPAEYLAGSYGARSTVLSTKIATAKGGFFSKQLSQAAADQIVTTPDCGVTNGIDLDITEPSLRHRVLLNNQDGLKAGTILDGHAIAHLKARGAKKVLVRSPLTCQADEGVCAKCTGADAKGHLPHMGEAVGITAANAAGEPLTQGALNAKHQAGQAKGQKQYAGFDVINRFAQSPEVFEDKATVAEDDGVVHSIDPAPQGGSYVTVGDALHYVAPGYNVTVKPGQKVEAGDALSEGLVDPADIVRHKGIGAGRRYYAERFKQLMDDSGHKTDLRHTEMLARAAINHVEIEDNDGPEGSLPGDVLSYNSVAARHVPPAETLADKPSKLLGHYLQAPALHFTIGTRITPSVVSKLEETGMDRIQASKEPPAFRPDMVRLQSAAHNNPDWLASQFTSHLKKQLSEHAIRGSDTNVSSNVHFVPRLAVGEGFGSKIEETGKF